MQRLVSLLLLACVSVACAATNDVYEVGPEQQAAGGERVSEEQLRLPKVVPAVPVFALSRPKGFRARHVRDIDRMNASAAVASLSIRKLRVDGPKDRLKLRVAAVDPLEFRSVAPPSTRSADFVWMTLMGGDAVVTHQAGKKLGINGSKDIKISGSGTFRVGALADNGTPNHADVLIAAPNEKAWKRITTLVFGARTGASLDAIERGIDRRLGNVSLTRLIPSTEKVVPKQETTSIVQAPSSTFAGLHPTMAASVQRLLQAAGGRVWLVSGYRDPARQYQLWLAALDKYGDPEVADNWVARPGHSMHEHGLAVDLGGDLDYAAALIRELGLPLWRPMSWEPWHFELQGSRG